MKFLQELLGENITVAASVAGGAQAGGTLFKGGVMKRDKKKKKSLTDAYRLDPEKIKMIKPNWNWRIMGEMMDMEGPSAADLDALEKGGHVPSNDEINKDFRKADPRKSAIRMVKRAVLNGASIEDAIEDVVRFFDSKGGRLGYVDPDELYDAFMRSMESVSLKEMMDSNLKGQSEETA